MKRPVCIYKTFKLVCCDFVSHLVFSREAGLILGWQVQSVSLPLTEIRFINALDFGKVLRNWRYGPLIIISPLFLLCIG